MIKFRDVMSFEQEMKKTNSSLNGFYHEVDYWSRFNKCIENFDEIASQVPKEIRKKVDH